LRLTERDKPRQEPELSPQQLLVVDALMTGAADREAAERAGVSRQTIRKWMNDDLHLRSEMNQGQREL
jgi:transposase